MSLPKIFVAFDFSDKNQADSLLLALNPALCGVKVGLELFTTLGPNWVSYAIQQGFPVFLDLKYHDIPNTVAKSCLAAAQLGVQMMNVHASGGLAMMQAAREALQTLPSPPVLLGVTVLTSLSELELSTVGVTGGLPAQVERLAALNQQAGLDGVVCSAHEAAHLRLLFGPSFKLITPGIRVTDTPIHDQKRIMTPEAAMAAGSDCLVIGRCITQAPNPAKKVEEILRRIDLTK